VLDREDECAVEWCHESVFRSGLCWNHLIEEKTALWDAQQAERETCLAGVGYLFRDKWDPALDLAWWGDPIEEVYHGT